MISYELISETAEVEEEQVNSYGIICKKAGKVLLEIHDISENKALIEGLIKDCNELDLSPEHLQDVVEDIIIQI
ncbi:MAG: DUF6514 family protein [Clostridia bacterium]|nr:DUF6514 family protein [Clostridia bacterium]